MSRVVAIVVTHDPDLVRFGQVLGSLVGEVDGVVIVDNASRNIGDIEVMCKSLPIKCGVVRLQFNSGIAHALMIGTHHVIRNYSPS